MDDARRRGRKAEPKPITLALQGGDAHGAFTWGVLDRLLENDGVAIEAISGTSAGAMNGTALASGLAAGGREGGRAALARFRAAIGGLERLSPFPRMPWDRLAGRWSLDHNPGWIVFDIATRLFSPHQVNPRTREADAEVVVCLVQVAAIVMFAALCFTAERAFPPDVPFEPVPVTLAAYAVLTAIRLALALTRRLTPTLLYVFILIALRALRFEPVLLTGTTAALLWLSILGHAIAEGGMAVITRDYIAYMAGARVLVGAEIDKVVSILAVSAILALAIVRARRVLVQASAGTIAWAKLARFFAPEVAQRIIGAERAVPPGDAELRHGAALMVDLRGFSALAATLDPPGLMRLLADYQALVVPIIAAEGRSIDTFLGDGILASFARSVRCRTPRRGPWPRSRRSPRRARAGPRAVARRGCRRRASVPRSPPERWCSARSATPRGSNTRCWAIR